MYRYETWLTDLRNWCVSFMIIRPVYIMVNLIPCYTAVRKTFLIHSGIVPLTMRCSVSR